MRLLICGSRNFEDFGLLAMKLSAIVSQVKTPVVVVSGCSRGADHMGEQWAKARGYEVEQYPADWSQGKSAGYRRNQKMINTATHVVAFWDGVSKGTEHTINLAKSAGLPLRIVEVGDVEAAQQFTRAVRLVMDVFDGEVVSG